MLKIIPFHNEFLEEAYELFVKKYQRMVKKNKLLPKKYLKKEEIISRLEYISKNYKGVVAISNHQVVGYLTGFLVDDFKSSHKGIYTPEWGHASLDDDISVFNEMYQVMFEQWIQKGACLHAITILEDEEGLKKNLFYYGHGLLVIDTLRNVGPISNINENIMVRLASFEDVSNLIDIMREHQQYLLHSPTFLYDDENIEDMVKEFMKDDSIKTFIALYEDKIVGMMNVLLKGGDSATIARDDDILKISSTHVLGEYQNQSIAKTMLHEVNRFAIDNGYNKLSVDFESANLKARGFWLKHFDIICYSLIRYIDDRIQKKDKLR